MDTFEAFQISATIHRGLRVILKNSFIHTEANEDTVLRAQSAPPAMTRASLAEKSVSTEFADKTTLMIRNIPTRFTQESLLELFSCEFPLCHVDFFYLPMDFKSGKNLGYCFVNFVSSAQMCVFMSQFQTRKLSGNSDKLLSITLAKIQGYEKNFNLFKVSAVMTVAHPKFRPMISCPQCSRLAPLANDVGVVICNNC